MFYTTIRGRKTPITLRNKLNFIVRRCELVGLASAVQHYGGKFLRTAPKNNNEVRGQESTPAQPDEQNQYFGHDSDSGADDGRPSGSVKWGAIYERSSGTIFRKVVGKLPIALENYAFVDLGSGKGFALCLAAEFPFKKVIGVEYSKSLAEAGAENLRTYQLQNRKCKDAVSVYGDATDFQFPPEPTVLYLYNAFQGKVMDRVISNLKKSLRENPRDLWVFYTSPWEHRKFKRSREFELIELTWDYALYRFRMPK